MWIPNGIVVAIFTVRIGIAVVAGTTTGIITLGMRNEDFCDVKKFRAHLSLLLSISPEFAWDERCHRRKIYYRKCVGIF